MRRTIRAHTFNKMDVGLCQLIFFKNQEQFMKRTRSVWISCPVSLQLINII